MFTKIVYGSDGSDTRVRLLHLPSHAVHYVAERIINDVLRFGHQHLAKDREPFFAMLFDLSF